MNFENLGLQIPRVLLPRQGSDLTKWAVIACDQFTSQPEYWKQVEGYVGDAPSTLKLVFPEVYLDRPGEEERIGQIHHAMKAYLNAGLLEPFEGLVYVDRRVDTSVRHGLLLCLDLEKYDYHAGAKSLIRATEGTILERLPPRMRIRRGASLELPHILVLIDDPQKSVIEPLAQLKPRLKALYDFDLMFDSGHLSAWLVQEPGIEEQVLRALNTLADPQKFSDKYELEEAQPVLLFAMGDGNHSLATAKAIWEEMKAEVGMNHPSRYALVEVENVHNPALQFKPIHRLLYDLNMPIISEMRSFFQDNLLSAPCASLQELMARVDAFQGVGQAVGCVLDGKYHLLQFTRPISNLPVGTLQAFLDFFMDQRGAAKLDYVHGEQVLGQLGSQAGNAGFYLAPMQKSDLFKTVILDGVLPRKTFSMGEAKEKRFYMEARKII